MFVEGNPAPTFKFFKGTSEIIEGGRYKLISDGDNNNMIMMAIAKVKSSDESEYKVYIENEHGSDEANFMLFVSGLYFFCLSIFFVVKISLSKVKYIHTTDTMLKMKRNCAKIQQNSYFWMAFSKDFEQGQKARSTPKGAQFCEVHFSIQTFLVWVLDAVF